eukprot:12668_1
MVDKPISTTQRIDNALARYYKDCRRNDYFDEESGQGKFRKDADDEFEGYDTDYLDEQLGDDANDIDPMFDDIDPMFPLPISTNESRANDIFQVFKHCYKHGVAPLSLIWQYIANALKH